MAGLVFSDVAQVLNFSPSIRITLEPKSKGPGWEIYEAEHRVHLNRYPLDVIYFSSSADKREVESVLQYRFRENAAHVVYAQSLKERVPLLARFAKEHAASIVLPLPEYLISFFKTEIDTYLAALADFRPKDFVEPSFATPARFQRKRPNPVLNFLVDPAQSEVSTSIGVVLGEPGQGKTYLSKHLVSELASYKAKSIVPVFVDSSQWLSIAPENLSSLSKTILHSFRALGTPISAFEGNEEECLRVLMKSDVFRVVFDGFDEYILRNQGRFSAEEALAALRDLAVETNARILISSRTSYWRQVEESETGNGEGLTDSYFPFEIRDFDRQQVRTYFERKLQSSESVSRAVSMFERLDQSNVDLIKRGFCMSLIADLASRDDADFMAAKDRPSLRWLLERLCEREKKRQNLVISADDQLKLFEEFAAETSSGEPATTETLSLLIEAAFESIDANQRRRLVESLAPHPLVRRVPPDNWEFTHEAVRIELLASSLLDESNNLQLFARSLSESASHVFLRDVVSALTRKMVRDSSGPDLESGLVKYLARVRTCDGRAIQRFYGHLLHSFLNVMSPLGRERSERREQLVALAGGSEISCAAFEGDFASLDLAGFRFRECTFEHVRWTKCSFQVDTVFERCDFRGGSTSGSTGLGLARREDCRLDSEAMEMFRREEVRAGRAKYSRDDLRRDLESLLAKFVRAGGLSFGTVRASDLKKGPISASQFGREILAVFEARLLDKHSVSGIGDGGFHLKTEVRDAVRYLEQNGVLTGEVERVFSELSRKLGL